jgi:hypothetical protein
MNRMLEILAITDQFVQALPKGIEITSLKSDGADFYLHLECTGTDEREPIDVFDSIAPRSVTENGRWRDCLYRRCKATIDNGENLAEVIIGAHEPYDAIVYTGSWTKLTQPIPLGVQVWRGDLRIASPIQAERVEFRVHTEWAEAFQEWAHDQEIVLDTPQDLPNTPD